MPDLSGILRQAQALLSSGHHAKAIPYLEQAMRMQPRNAAIQLALGEALESAGRGAEAITAYKKCLRLKSDYTDAWTRLAATHQQLKQNEEAAKAYQQALAHGPARAEMAFNLGCVLYELGRLGPAADAFHQAIALNPQLAEPKNGLGMVLISGKKFTEAAEVLQQALALRPNYPDAQFNLGNALLGQERWAEAVAQYRSIGNPGELAPKILNHTGLALWHLRNFEEAAEIHARVVALNPDFAEAHNNLGNDLRSLHRLDEAETALQRALQLRPNYHDAYLNLGNVYLAQNRLDESLTAYRHAAAGGNHPLVEYNEGYALLLKGDLPNGFLKYEHRWALNLAGRQPRDFKAPRWRGEDPAGRTILLFSEQGLGDTLQFARYAPLLAQQGAKIVLCVQPPLRDLLASLPCDKLIVSDEEPLPPHDLFCPLLSLPLVFKTDLGSIPAQVPYLQAPPDKVSRWKERFSSTPGPRIGIVCSGNPKHVNDHNRSVPLSSFAPLAAIAGAPLYLIQKDLRPTDAATLADRSMFTDLSRELGDFTDTGAIIANLDLVISVDTSLVHLAGALGKPVWTLVSFAPDWRWLLGRSDSPWYPTMRLFRQPAPGQWSPVFSDLAAALTAFVKQR